MELYVSLTVVLAHLIALAAPLQRAPNDPWTEGDIDVSLAGEVREALLARFREAAPIDHYWTVDSDITVAAPPEPTVGSLFDDLADIHAELSGLVTLQLGRTSDDAIRGAWAASFQSHWGQHACEALAAIQAELRRTRSAW